MQNLDFTNQELQKFKEALKEHTRLYPEIFVPEELKDQAYNDNPLPIGYDETISQPYMVAFMPQSLGLQPEYRVLEIGTGSGYQTAKSIRASSTVTEAQPNCCQEINLGVGSDCATQQ